MNIDGMRENQEELIAKAERAKATAVEAHEKKIAKAASVLAMLETEGGKALVAELERVKLEDYNIPPEHFMHLANDADGGASHYVVDSVNVARCAGAREMIDVMLGWFETCRSVIEQEAKKKSMQK